MKHIKLREKILSRSLGRMGNHRKRCSKTAGELQFSNHSYFHTQSTFVASGKFEVVIDGRKEVLSTEDGFLDLPNLKHGVKCLEAGMLIDVFSPLREDFLE